MKQILTRILITSAVMTLFGVPLVASAKQASSTPATGPTATSSPTATETEQKAISARAKIESELEAEKSQRKADVSEVKADFKQKLDTDKLKVCQAHQSQINSIMKNMDDRRQTAYDKITSIATAIEQFYARKQLSVNNYQDLVIVANAAQAAAQSAMSVQQSAPQLDCGSTQPRQDVSDFKDKRSDSIDAMEAYRQAVKTLGEAVKAAAEAAKTTALPSPSPTATPVTSSTTEAKP